MNKYFLLAALFFTQASYSQDNQYWTQQFGGRSAMLGGAVVGGVNDNSAIFYNPGALAFIKDASLSVNGNIYKVNVTSIENALGTDVDLKSTRFSLYPVMISGLVRFKKNDRFVGSYALITRHFGNEKLQTRQESIGDFFPELPAQEEFIGSFEYESRIFEQWGGFGVGYRVSESFSVGLSQFISYRGHVYKQTAFTRMIFTDSTDYLISSLTDNQDVVLDVFRLVWKAGIQYKSLNNWKLGLTITTPTVNVLGFANVSREISAYNYIDLESGRILDILALDRQKNLPARYRTPLSIAIGVEKKFNKSTIAFTAEYFHKLNKYQVAEPNPEPFARPSTFDFDIDEADFLSVVYAADPIINFALGYEHSLSEKYTIYTSVRTDFSAKDEDMDPGNEMTVSDAYWNVYHATLGFSIRKGATLTSIGGDYALGFNRRNENFDRFDRPESIYRGLFVEPVEMRTAMNGLSLMIGFTYYMKRG